MSKQLQKAIELAKKTGDRVIVFSGQEDEDGYVILPFAEYEKLLNLSEKERGLTQKEMLDSINRDVAEWKNSHGFGFSGDDESEEDVDQFNKKEEDDSNSGAEDESEYEKKFLKNNEVNEVKTKKIPGIFQLAEKQQRRR